MEVTADGAPLFKPAAAPQNGGWTSLGGGLNDWVLALAVAGPQPPKLIHLPLVVAYETPRV